MYINDLESFSLTKFRLPTLSHWWTKNMTSGEPRDILPNIETLMIEETSVDMQFIQYVFARSSVKNFSVKGSFVFDNFIIHPMLLPGPPPPRNFEQVLRFLDVSRSSEDAMKLVREWVMYDEQCKVTHLFMEQCSDIPRCVMSVHLKIEVLSIAGYIPETDDVRETSIFLDILSWALIPSMREINASACRLNEEHRNALIKNSPNVVFDFNDNFRESSRVFF
jgi:hypothetical protein